MKQIAQYAATGIIVLASALLLVHVPIYQPAHYHEFADQSSLPVFAHAGTNGVLLCQLLGLEPVPWEWDRFVTHHASITRLSTMEMRDGYTFALNRLSDVEHLPRDARTL